MNDFAPSEGPALKGLEKTLNEYLVTKAPFQLPANVREIIVRYSPWISLIILILLLPAVLAVFALGALVGGVAASVGVLVGPLYYVGLVVLLLQVALLGLAIPGLMKRKLSGWKFIYYSELIAVVYTAVNWLGVPANVGGLISGLLSAVIGLYVLFQIRSYYR